MLTRSKIQTEDRARTPESHRGTEVTEADLTHRGHGRSSGQHKLTSLDPWTATGTGGRKLANRLTGRK